MVLVLDIHEPHALTGQEVLTRLGSRPTGLTHEEAAQRLAEHGPNELAAAGGVSWAQVLWAQFKNVLIVVLLVAIALSAVLGHALEAAAIAVILAFTVVLGFIQEFRAEKSLEALRKLAAPVATVVRAGDEQKIPARELVPGDVLVLHAGDKVAADGRLLEAVNLQVVEAALTGESTAVEKSHHALPAGALPVGDRTNMVHSGTAVTYGRGRAVVSHTGQKTEFGKIAQLLRTVDTSRTPLQQNLDRVGRTLGWAAGAVVLIIVALGVWRGQPLVEMIIFGIALAVAVVPEALPAVVTISLALGVQRLVKRNALVRKLAAAETLGSTSFICSDKTGTLTRDEMTARALYVDGRTLTVSGAGYDPVGDFFVDEVKTPPSPEVLQLLTAAALASDATVEWDEERDAFAAQGDPTEAALVVAAQKAGLEKADLDQAYPRVDEEPFTAETKRMITVHDVGGRRVAYVKGAPEALLPLCDFSDEARAEVDAAAQRMAMGALRVLAVATKDASGVREAQHGLTFLGLVGMIDPPRSEAKAALEKCREAGVKVAMITGDHPATAKAIAAELGLLQRGQVMTGAGLEKLSHAELHDAVEGVEVYARVSPADKLRIVTALQQCGHVVAMTGDGVNDAPALKKADIGIAMGVTGTDVTREAAAMTLTDDNFASIVGAVEEGRAIYGNIKKYLMYLLSSNIGEIGLMAGAALLGLPLPLSAVQILYVNLATDGLPALALALDPPEDDLMKRPPRPRDTGIFTRPVVALMLSGGAWSALVNIGLFWWALSSGHSQARAMMMSFLTLVLIQFVKAYNFRSDRHHVWHAPFANKWLNLAILWELAMLAVIIYVPGLKDAFGTQVLPLKDWAVIAFAALTVLPVLEATKALARRGVFGKMV